MNAWLAAGASAAGLGLLTGTCNCGLSANVLAVSFIGRQLKKPRLILLAGVLYALGRTLAYVFIAALLVNLALAKEDVKLFLDHYLNTFLGPLLIVTGMFMLGLIPLAFGGFSVGEKLRARLGALGMAGPVFLGILLALALCPTAAWYFGGLLELCLERRSAYLLPTLYGAGTALPALVFAFVLAYAARLTGEAFNKVALFEKWARLVAGLVFIGVGMYYTLVYIYGWA
jgi:cytochrome c biogenesis protein CcdA